MAVAVGDPGHPVLAADEDGEQRCGLAAVGRKAPRAGGHLHQGVGPALLGRAGQAVCGPRVTAEGRSGLGPVGLEQLVLQPGQLLGHDGAVDGVEVDGPEPAAA